MTESLSLVQQWETGGYQDAYERINDLLLPVYQQSAAAIASVGDDEAAKALLYGNIGEAITGKDDSFVSQPDRDVDKVFHFFERAAICSDEAICDYPVLKTFFGSEASSFWLYFGKYAERRQADGYAGYGDVDAASSSTATSRERSSSACSSAYSRSSRASRLEVSQRLPPIAWTSA